MKPTKIFTAKGNTYQCIEHSHTAVNAMISAMIAVKSNTIASCNFSAIDVCSFILTLTLLSVFVTL